MTPRNRRLFSLGIAVLVLAVAAWWASEPFFRRAVLFEAPIRLQAGTAIAGHFAPERGEPHGIELRFRQAWIKPRSEAPDGNTGELEALSKAVGGGWHGPIRPAGLKVSYVVRHGRRVVAEGMTGEHLTGWFGPEEVGILLVWIDVLPPGPLEFEVRIVEAVEPLTAWNARLIVGPQGDWISYASVEGTLRLCAVLIAATVALVVWLVVSSLRGRRRLAAGSKAS